jgi:alcohol dehydrogenase class IV
MAMHQFSFPTPISFGEGVRNLVGEHLRGQGLSRPLVVTDRGIAALPMREELEAHLRSARLTPSLFSGVHGNPVKSQVVAGVAAYRADDADSIVGFGGGAALDVAKTIALLVSHPGDLFDYEDGKPDALPVDGPMPYWVAIPTTAGTGSEVGRSAVVSDDATHLKRIIFSPRLLARAVFADPELTLGLPAPVTAATGMDALSHNVEAYLARGFHPLCDGIALEGMRLVSRNLVTCVREPGNREARAAMLMASMMGAIAFQKGLGIVHSCAHALSAVADLHHGLACGIMIDHALAHNVGAVPERFQAMAQSVGLKSEAPDAFLRWLAELKGAVGIPPGLGGAGVTRDRFGKLVEVAIADGCHPSNPRACNRETFVGVFTAAL